MAGSHRAPGPPKRTPSARSAVVAVVAVAAVIGGVYAFENRSSDDPVDSGLTPPTPTPSSLPTVVITPTPTPTTTPTTAPTTKPTSPAALPRVTPSAPRRLVVRGLLDVGFDSAVAPRNGVFSAGSTAEVARWGGRGVPGSPSDDTVFVIGKVSASGAFAALPNLRRGTRVSLRTETGTLTYTVQTSDDEPAQGLTRDATFTARVPGRLQLVGIRYDARGDRTGAILVVTAQLTGARRS